jgi:hypothetical protein
MPSLLPSNLRLEASYTLPRLSPFHIVLLPETQALNTSNLTNLRETAAERRPCSRRLRPPGAELLRQEDHGRKGSSFTEPEGRISAHRRHPRQRPQLRPPTSITNCAALGELLGKPLHTNGRNRYAYLLDMISGVISIVCHVAGEPNAIRWHQHSSTLHNSNPHKPNIESVSNELRKPAS